MAKQRRKFMTSKGIVSSNPNSSTIVGNGWADYADTQYNSSSPFSISANTDTDIPNDGLAGPKSQIPAGISSLITTYDAGGYTASKINGITGDSYIITINCEVTPTSGATTFIEFWFDIGGSVGELYRRIISFPKGNGVARPVTISTLVYTLDTWESNGATVYCRANGTANIHSVRYVIERTYKA